MALGRASIARRRRRTSYAKLVGKGTALDELRAQTSVRFKRPGRRRDEAGAAPA